MKSAAPMPLAELNALGRAAFVAALAEVFEHSPWVAELVAPERPFASVSELHAAMVDAVAGAGIARQMALLRAHPELAGQAAVRGELTPESTREQAGAGLAHCTPDEFARLQQLNRAYSDKFGFPFIVAVKGLDRAAIIARCAERLASDRAAEIHTALDQVARIARFRLEAMISG